GDELRAEERWERRRHALARRLVAGDASGGIDLLAARDELGRVPLLVRVFGLGEERLFLLADPFAVVLLRDDAHHDRPEAVPLAAELHALAAERAGHFR